MITLIVPIAIGLLSAPAPERPAEPVPVLQLDARGAAVAFAPNGRLLACNLVLRDVDSGKVLGAGDPGEKTPSCTCVAFSPDGQRLASVHYDRHLIEAPHAVCLWDVTAENHIRRAATLLHVKSQTDYEESLHYLIFSPDGKLLASRLPRDTAVVWDTTTGKERLRLEIHGLAVAFAPDGRTLTSVSRTGLVQHWDLATGKCAGATEDPRTEGFLFVCMAVASADGKTVALSDHHSVVLKETQSGKLLRRFDDLAAEYLALSADGKTLAVAVD